jgi:hypothetical protein
VPGVLQLGAALTTRVRSSSVSPISSFLPPVIWFLFQLPGVCSRPYAELPRVGCVGLISVHSQFKCV